MKVVLAVHTSQTHLEVVCCVSEKLISVCRVFDGVFCLLTLHIASHELYLSSKMGSSH